MDKAMIAVIVSTASAAVSLFSLAWQLTLYRLSGARLRVQLVFEFHDEWGTIRAISGRQRRPWGSVMRDSNISVANHFGIECVRVRVTNVGRTAVSVENIALDVGRTKWWRRGRKTFVPWLFYAKDDDRAAAVTLSSVRLEAGATTSQVFHLWPGVRAQVRKLKDGQTLTVRGTATAAGRRPTLSSRRFAWKFQHGDESWFTDYDVTPEMRVYRSVWQSSYADYVGGLPLLFHRDISTKFREGATAKDIEEYLKSHRDDGIFGLAAFDAHKAFHANENNGGGDPILEPDREAEIDTAAETQSG